MILGYFLLKHPSPFELESQVVAQNREFRERLFFQTSPWMEQNLDKDKSKGCYGASTGKHLQKIDKALPGKHTTKLYNALDRTAAAILVQLRTNISRHDTYLSKINVVDTDRCERETTETVLHSCTCAQDGGTKDKL